MPQPPYLCRLVSLILKPSKYLHTSLCFVTNSRLCDYAGHSNFHSFHLSWHYLTSIAAGNSVIILRVTRNIWRVIRTLGRRECYISFTKLYWYWQNYNASSTKLVSRRSKTPTILTAQDHKTLRFFRWTINSLYKSMLKASWCFSSLI